MTTTDTINTYSVEHTGQVIAVYGDKAIVRVEKADDCEGCSVRSSCHSTSFQDKIGDISVPAYFPGSDILLKKGDSVKIGLTEKLQAVAIVFTFVIPLMLLVVGVLVPTMIWNSSEVICIFCGLGLIVLYDLVVFTCFRQKIRKKCEWSVVRLL